MAYLNIGIALLIVLIAVFVVRRYLKNTKTSEDAVTEQTFTVDKPSVDKLIIIVSKAINSFLRQDFSNQNLTKAEYDNKNAAKARLRRAQTQAKFRNLEARAMILEYIKSIITTNNELRVSELNIDQLVPFDRPEELSAQDKFLMILTKYQNNSEDGDDYISKMFEDLGWDKVTCVDNEKVNEAYDLLSDDEACREKNLPIGYTVMSYDDKLNYIVQEVFQGYEGFGTADRLFDTSVDEIDAGVSGYPVGMFNLSNRVAKKAKYSYDSIWILMHGINIHLECLSFGSEEELERVCENIYKYNAQKVFSQSSGYVVSSMENGSRVLVTRPPLSDKFAFYVRKFDSAPSIEPEALIKGEGYEIPLLLSKWFVKGQRNIAVTGQQGTGKTTMLKAFMKWITLNIRTQELAFEMNLPFSYPDKNISSFQETDMVSAQEGLNVQKKTNGAVNVVGEVATAEQASHVVQTANVASLHAMFTHHAKTTKALVTMFAMNLLQMNLYKEKRDAIEITANTLNIDVHLTNTSGYRYIERISEIIPLTDEAYPSEKIREEALETTGETLPYTDELARLDKLEYYKRSTDRELFKVNELCRWVIIPGSEDPRNGYFELENMPSKTTLTEMRRVFTNPQTKAEFEHDMEYIQEINKKVHATHTEVA